MQKIIDHLKSKNMWNENLVFFDPQRVQIQEFNDGRTSVGVMIKDISIREYLEKINFDFSNKPVFKSVIDEFDEFEWGLRIYDSELKNWHFLINFELVRDNYIHSGTKWDPNTGNYTTERFKNPSSSNRIINNFFPLNPIHTVKTKERFLKNHNGDIEAWEDAITNVSFGYDYENDKILDVFRSYTVFELDYEKVAEWEKAATGAHAAGWSPILGDIYQHTYKTIDNKFKMILENNISTGKSDLFNDTVDIVNHLNPLEVWYASFKRDDEMTGLDIWST